MDAELMCGPMAAATTVNGARISYTGKESTNGPTAEYIPARTSWTRNTGLACTSGPMERGMKDFGPTVNNTGKASSRIRRERVASGSGRKERALSGSQALLKSLICTLIIQFSSSK